MSMGRTVSSGFRKALLACGLLVLVAVASLGAGLILSSRADAQTPRDPRGGQQPGQGAELNATLSCFAPQRVVARTWDNEFVLPVGDFVNIPAAGLNIVVPAGTDCIFVEFTGAARTIGNGGECLFRALINGDPMSPGDAGGQAGVVAPPNVPNLSWARQVTVASQTTFLVQIQMRAVSQTCFVKNWLLKVSRLD
jgi:hypothetical protein